MIKKISIILVLLMLIVISGCKETLTEPCGPDIKITIVTQYDDCNGNCLPAEDTKITISQSTVLLDSGITIKDRYTYTPINSGCGISNLTISAYPNYFRNLPESIFINYICADTTIYICMPCDTMPPTTCNSPGKIDTIEYKYMYSQDNCIPKDEKIKHQSVTYRNSTPNDIIIENIVSILNYNQKIANGNKFRFVMSDPNISAGGTFTLRSGDDLTLFFEVITDEIGKFSDRIQLPVYCVGNPSAKENWDIVLLAEVCETPCDCPVSPDKDPYYAGVKDAESLQQGETKSFNNVKVLEIPSGALQQGCYMTINDIVRIDDQGAEYSTRGWNNNPYQLNQINPQDDWTILTQGPYSNKITAGGSLSLNVRVGPVSRSGYLRDTFKLRTTIYDKDGNVKDANCEYKFYLQGKTCEDVCAILEIIDLNSEQGSKNIAIKEINTLNVANRWDAVLFNNAKSPINPINMGNYYNNNELFMKFNSDFNPDGACTTLVNSTSEFEFKVKIDKNVLFCDRHKYDIGFLTTGEQDSEIDRKYFSYTPDNYTLSKFGEFFTLNVAFKPPTARELETLWNNGSKPNGDSTFKFRLQIWNQSINCHIVLNFEAKINGLPPISPKRHLDAFNRITTKRLTPNYFVANIKEKTQHYYSKTKNLLISDTKIMSDPPNNSPNTDDNFYINVDTPKDMNVIGEYPELYLVQTSNNIFNRVTTEPIARYRNYDEFAADLGNLIKDIFSGNFSTRGQAPNRNFSYNPTTLQWSNSADKDDFNPGRPFGFPNGIPLIDVPNNKRASSVYMIWSTNAGSYTYNGMRFPCELAFIFIDEIQNGEETDNSDRRAKILFNVVYPINK